MVLNITRYLIDIDSQLTLCTQVISTTSVDIIFGFHLNTVSNDSTNMNEKSIKFNLICFRGVYRKVSLNYDIKNGKNTQTNKKHNTM
jgi:hypothetical protein